MGRKAPETASMPRLGLTFAIVAACIGSLVHPAQADEASDKKAADSLAKAFVSLCVQSMPHLDQLETSATSHGWKKLDDRDGVRFAAPSPTAKSTAWTVQGAADVPFWLIITRGATEHRKTIAVCTIVETTAPPAEVKAALVGLLDLGYPIHDEERDGQQETYWNATFEGVSLVVSLSEAASPPAKGVSMSATSIENAP